MAYKKTCFSLDLHIIVDAIVDAHQFLIGSSCFAEPTTTFCTELTACLGFKVIYNANNTNTRYSKIILKLNLSFEKKCGFSFRYGNVPGSQSKFE